jgi:hypothetical protein
MTMPFGWQHFFASTMLVMAMMYTTICYLTSLIFTMVAKCLLAKMVFD